MKTHKQKVIQAYQEWEVKYEVREGLILTLIVNLVAFSLVFILANTQVVEKIDNIHPVVSASIAVVVFFIVGYYLIWGRK